MKNIRFIILLLCISNSIFAQLNLSLKGTLTYPGHSCAGLWQYVDSLNNEYALVGVDDHISIVNVTNSTNPVEVFSVPALTGQTSLWREIKIYGKYAYAVSEGGGGVIIIDLSNLPASISSTRWYGNNAIAGQITSAHTVAATDGYLYIFGASILGGGALIADLSDPLNPNYVGAYTGNYVHDGYIRNDTLYASEVYLNQFSIIDVTNKTNPVLLTTVNSPGGYCHNTWLSDNSKFLYTSNEQPNAPVGIFDISDINNIELIDTYYTDSMPTEEVHNVRVFNDYLINPSYGSQLTICDAQRPNNVIEIANYTTGTYLCWDASPYLPSGNIIATDINGELFVFDPTYLRACYLEGIITDSITTTSLPGATIKILNTTVTDNTALNGSYATGVLIPGLYDIEVSRPGYFTKIFTGISLSNGNLTQLDVALVPFTLYANVSNALNNLPIPNAELKLSNSSGTFSFTSDINGNFTIANVSTGTYDLFVAKWGFNTYCSSVLVDGITPINVQLTPGYYDDFATDEGWSVTSTSSSGFWTRGVPVGTLSGSAVANPGFDVNNDCGNDAFITGNGGGNPTTDDVDNGGTTLTSPTFDLSTYLNPILEYSTWFFEPSNLSASFDDTLFIALSNGALTLRIDTISKVSGLSSWLPRVKRISDFLTPTSNMQLIAFIEDKPGTNNILEAGFDHFKITDGAIGVAEFKTHEFYVFPNPFSSNCTIQLNSNINPANCWIAVTDISGRELFREKIKSSKHVIEGVATIIPGIYLLQLHNGDHDITVQRIVKTQ